MSRRTSGAREQRARATRLAPSNQPAASRMPAFRDGPGHVERPRPAKSVGVEVGVASKASRHAAPDAGRDGSGQGDDRHRHQRERGEAHEEESEGLSSLGLDGVGHHRLERPRNEVERDDRHQEPGHRYHQLQPIAQHRLPGRPAEREIFLTAPPWRPAARSCRASESGTLASTPHRNPFERRGGARARRRRRAPPGTAPSERHPALFPRRRATANGPIATRPATRLAPRHPSEGSMMR